jgi:hypothetical protein
MRNRRPGLSEALAEVANIVGQEAAQNISTDNPAAVIEGRPAPWRPTPTLPVKKKKWFFLRGR